MSETKEVHETPTTYVAEQTVGQMNVADLRALIRQVIREEQPFHLDENGYLVFHTEAAYAAYLRTQPDKYPSEINAYYIDEHGFKVYYSDYEPTPEKARDLEEARREIAEGKTQRLEDVITELGLVIIEDIDQHDAAYRRLHR